MTNEIEAKRLVEGDVITELARERVPHGGLDALEGEDPDVELPAEVEWIRLASDRVIVGVDGGDGPYQEFPTAVVEVESSHRGRPDRPHPTTPEVDLIDGRRVRCRWVGDSDLREGREIVAPTGTPGRVFEVLSVDVIGSGDEAPAVEVSFGISDCPLSYTTPEGIPTEVLVVEEVLVDTPDREDVDPG